MPQRPSNREMKALFHMGEDKALGPDDFKDIGEKTFAGMLKKKWVEEAEGQPGNTLRLQLDLGIHEEDTDLPAQRVGLVRRQAQLLLKRRGLGANAQIGEWQRSRVEARPALLAWLGRVDLATRG